MQLQDRLECLIPDKMEVSDGRGGNLLEKHCQGAYEAGILRPDLQSVCCLLPALFCFGHRDGCSLQCFTNNRFELLRQLDLHSMASDSGRMCNGLAVHAVLCRQTMV